MPALAFLGPEGTFSHILALKRFGRTTNVLACPAIDAVVDAVRTGQATRGIVPIENSSGGVVYDAIDLLIRHADEIRIIEEVSMDIRIALLGRADQPIRTVFSHFVQIKHHADWLKVHLPDATVKEAPSTAQAAALAAKTPGAAALAAPGAADIYNLTVLATPATVGEINITQFFVIARNENPRPPARAPRTALVAALPNVCGSLHRFLGPFARHKVSLARIISRPVPGRPQTYVFFLEVEGSASHPPTAAALAGARNVSESFSVLGSYPTGKKFRS